MTKMLKITQKKRSTGRIQIEIIWSQDGGIKSWENLFSRILAACHVSLWKDCHIMLTTKLYRQSICLETCMMHILINIYSFHLTLYYATNKILKPTLPSTSGEIFMKTHCEIYDLLCDCHISAIPHPLLMLRPRLHFESLQVALQGNLGSLKICSGRTI